MRFCAFVAAEAAEGLYIVGDSKKSQDHFLIITVGLISYVRSIHIR